MPTLHTPIGPTDSVAKLLRESGHAQSETMVYFLRTLESLWPLCECRLCRALFDVCEMLSSAFAGGAGALRLNLYASAPAIFCRIEEEYWCGQVFQEETGADLQTFSAMCRIAQEEPLGRALLVEFLNRSAFTLA